MNRENKAEMSNSTAFDKGFEKTKISQQEFNDTKKKIEDEINSAVDSISSELKGNMTREQAELAIYHAIMDIRNKDLVPEERQAIKTVIQKAETVGPDTGSDSEVIIDFNSVDWKKELTAEFIRELENGVEII